MNAFEIASLSMDHDMQRVANIGQNLANTSTAGYKRVVQAQRPFTAAMLEAGADPGVDTGLDMAAGALRASSSPLDLAVQGDGLFLFDSAAGPVLSRQASLHVDGQGRLVNDAGQAVQSDRGDLHVTPLGGDLRIDANGEAWQGERSVGRLQLVRVGDPAKLVPLGGGLYRPADGDSTQPLDNVQVLSRQREASNVSSSAEMVRLMETTRHFEAMAKVVQGYDEAMDKAIRKLGDLGS
ncbi:MAG: flagellar hook basal-body protein [Burkholderiales bacterium]|nr:flagellar hook basal-body protein [Burkholderiales bacterium]